MSLKNKKDAPILEKFDLMVQHLRNTADNVAEDVFVDCDEVKAFGELALLQRYIEKFLRENWDS